MLHNLILLVYFLTGPRKKLVEPLQSRLPADRVSAPSSRPPIDLTISPPKESINRTETQGKFRARHVCALPLQSIYELKDMENVILISNINHHQVNNISQHNMKTGDFCQLQQPCLAQSSALTEFWDHCITRRRERASLIEIATNGRAPRCEITGSCRKARGLCFKHRHHDINNP